MNELLCVGDWVRIKPFVQHFGEIVEIKQNHPQPVAVVSATYNQGRVVLLRPGDVELVTPTGRGSN